MLWLLRRLERDGGATFGESELRGVDDPAFDALRAYGVLKLDREDADVSAWVHDGRLLTADIDMDGDTIAFDPDCPDDLPERISGDSLRRWKPDRLRIAQLIAERNDLVGAPEGITPRLVYVGRTDAGVAVTLALFANVTTAIEALVSLPELVGAGDPAGHAVIFPSLQPSRTMQAVFNHLRIRPARFASDDLVVAASGLQPLPGTATPAERPNPLNHSASFRWLEVDGVEHLASVNQALVLARMHQIGEPVSEAEVLEDFVDEIASKRFADVFKGSSLFGTFVLSAGKGIYKLKYY